MPLAVKAFIAANLVTTLFMFGCTLFGHATHQWISAVWFPIVWSTAYVLFYAAFSPPRK